jgi:23S rRNA (cytidine2498-2'-O)-methyltransferase
VFVTCQVGAEAAVKGELARLWPALRLAYSRPGFLTFKLPPAHLVPDDFQLHSVFARAYGFSLGKLSGTDPEGMARQAWQVWQDRPVARLHVWLRDVAAPGEREFEPSITLQAVEVAGLLHRVCPRPERLAAHAADPRRPARPGDLVLDCVLVGPEEWWVGYHRAGNVASRWPGGMMSLELPADAVSRAWLKMEEALRWSELPIRPRARCAEIGSAPGGASQALLARGVRVLGIDPAEMHPLVLAHPHFTHLRRRASQVRRREFRKIRWLTADMNVAPNYTLDVVEDIVTHAEVNVRGMLLTLKLFDWKLADDLPEYLDRIRRWGFHWVQARQLQHNRQEVTVAALKNSPTHKGTRLLARKLPRNAAPSDRGPGCKLGRGLG